MLKKLAKYGNSTTLVIDKAILELLNMTESSVVKLHTDGTSLIITPVRPEQAEDKVVSYEASEKMLAASETFKSKINFDEYYKLENGLRERMEQDYKDVFLKYGTFQAKFANHILNSAEFQEALAQVEYDPVKQNEEYLKEFNKLMVQFVPELGGMVEELAAVVKKYEKKS
jgi:antitoxin component of MazEF toxin-antitoxin module